MPDDRIQIVKSDPPAQDTDVRMEGKDEMPSKVTSGDTDVADDADEPSARDKNPEDMPPDLVQFGKKGLVVLDMAQLIRVLVVTLEIPVWRGGNDQMDRFILQEGKVPGVAMDESMNAWRHERILPIVGNGLSSSLRQVLNEQVHRAA